MGVCTAAVHLCVNAEDEMAPRTFWLGTHAGGQISMAGPNAARSSMKNVRCMPSMAESIGGGRWRATRGVHAARQRSQGKAFQG